jgi:hypothetical protein
VSSLIFGQAAKVPNIRTYDPGPIDIRPSETGAEATAAAARRGGAFFNQAAGAFATLGSSASSAIHAAGDVAVKAVDHAQVAHGAAVGAQMTDGLQKSWNSTFSDALKNDPNDASVAARWREQVLEPQLEKFKSGFLTEHGQAWAERYVETLRKQMFHVTAADSSTLAGEAATRSVQTIVKSLSSAVHDDPSLLDHSLETVRGNIDDLLSTSPNLSPPNALKFRAQYGPAAEGEIFTAAVKGAIDKNPEGGMKLLNDPRYEALATPAVRKGFGLYAQGVTRLREADAAHGAELAQRKEDDAVSQTMRELDAQTMPEQSGGAIRLPENYFQTVRDTANRYPDAIMRKPELLRSMISKGEAITARMNAPEPAAPVSQAATVDLLSRARASDPRDADAVEMSAYAAYRDGKLRSDDFLLVKGALQDLKTPAGAALARRENVFFYSVAPAVLGSDAAGKTRLYALQVDVARKIAEYRRAEKDPGVLFDPSKPDYLGKPDALAPYQRPSLQSTLPNLAAEHKPAGTAPPPRAQGETLDAWLTRTGRGMTAPPAAPVQ